MKITKSWQKIKKEGCNSQKGRKEGKKEGKKNNNDPLLDLHGKFFGSSGLQGWLL